MQPCDTAASSRQDLTSKTFCPFVTPPPSATWTLEGSETVYHTGGGKRQRNGGGADGPASPTTSLQSAADPARGEHGRSVPLGRSGVWTLTLDGIYPLLKWETFRTYSEQGVLYYMRVLEKPISASTRGKTRTCPIMRVGVSTGDKESSWFWSLSKRPVTTVRA